MGVNGMLKVKDVSSLGKVFTFFSTFSDHVEGYEAQLVLTEFNTLYSVILNSLFYGTSNMNVSS